MGAWLYKYLTACLSGAAKPSRRQRGEKNAYHASAVENWSTALRVPSAAGAWWLILLTFFLSFYTILTSIERGPSAVEKGERSCCSVMWDIDWLVHPTNQSIHQFITTFPVSAKIPWWGNLSHSNTFSWELDYISTWLPASVARQNPREDSAARKMRTTRAR